MKNKQMEVMEKMKLQSFLGENRLMLSQYALMLALAEMVRHGKELPLYLDPANCAVALDSMNSARIVISAASVYFFKPGALVALLGDHCVIDFLRGPVNITLEASKFVGELMGAVSQNNNMVVLTNCSTGYADVFADNWRVAKEALASRGS